MLLRSFIRRLDDIKCYGVENNLAPFKTENGKAFIYDEEIEIFGTMIVTRFNRYDEVHPSCSILPVSLSGSLTGEYIIRYMDSSNKCVEIGIIDTNMLDESVCDYSEIGGEFNFLYREGSKFYLINPASKVEVRNMPKSFESIIKSGYVMKLKVIDGELFVSPVAKSKSPTLDVFNSTEYWNEVEPSGYSKVDW